MYKSVLGVWEYIEATRDQVCDLEHRVRLVKGNVEAISTIMAKWCEAPLYQRKEDKKDCLLNLEVSGYDIVFCHINILHPKLMVKL